MSDEVKYPRGTVLWHKTERFLLVSTGKEMNSKDAFRLDAIHHPSEVCRAYISAQEDVGPNFRGNGSEYIVIGVIPDLYPEKTSELLASVKKLIDAGDFGCRKEAVEKVVEKLYRSLKSEIKEADKHD